MEDIPKVLWLQSHPLLKGTPSPASTPAKGLPGSTFWICVVRLCGGFSTLSIASADQTSKNALPQARARLLQLLGFAPSCISSGLAGSVESEVVVTGDVRPFAALSVQMMAGGSSRGFVAGANFRDKLPDLATTTGLLLVLRDESASFEGNPLFLLGRIYAAKI